MVRYPYTVLSFIIVSTCMLSQGLQAADNAKMASADELISKLPGVSDALKTLKDVDAKMFQQYQNNLKESIDVVTTIAAGGLLGKAGYIKQNPVPANIIPNLGITISTPNPTWVDVFQTLLKNSADKNIYSDQAKNRFLDNLKKAQNLVLDESLASMDRLMLGLYWNATEECWQYFDAIWNKEKFAPELKKLGESLKKAGKNQEAFEKDIEKLKQQLNSEFVKILMVANQSLAGASVPLTNTGGDDAVNWQTKYTNTINSIANRSFYESDNEQDQAVKDLKAAKKTIENSSINLNRRKLLYNYWANILYPIWEFYDKPSAKDNLKPILDDMKKTLKL